MQKEKTSGEVLLLVAGSHGDVVSLVRGVVAYARSPFEGDNAIRWNGVHERRLLADGRC